MERDCYTTTTPHPHTHTFLQVLNFTLPATLLLFRYAVVYERRERKHIFRLKFFGLYLTCARIINANCTAEGCFRFILRSGVGIMWILTRTLPREKCFRIFHRKILRINGKIVKIRSHSNERIFIWFATVFLERYFAVRSRIKYNLSLLFRSKYKMVNGNFIIDKWCTYTPWKWPCCLNNLL